jgi:hypothetical protein
MNYTDGKLTKIEFSRIMVIYNIVRVQEFNGLIDLSKCF